MPITALDIRAIVEKEDDFGHELRVGRILRGYGDGKLLHGGTYTDPITKKPRQYDFRLYYSANERAISLAVECKNVKSEAPVVISGRQRRREESVHDLVEARTGGRFRTPRGPAYVDFRSFGVVRTVRVNSIYVPGAFVGKSMLKIQTAQMGKPPKIVYSGDSDAEIHQRWSQALSSCDDLVVSACKSASHNKPHVFTLVLPVVVFPDNTLWKIEYDDEGQPTRDPTKADECEFYVDRECVVRNRAEGLPQLRFVISHIHFFTMTGFAWFLRRITTDHDWRQSAFDPEVLAAARAERLDDNQIGREGASGDKRGANAVVE